jgi:hypothetical protein
VLDGERDEPGSLGCNERDRQSNSGH